MKSPLLFFIAALFIVGCSPFPYLENSSRTYYITTTGSVDTTCIKEKGTLSIVPSRFNTHINVGYFGQADSVIIHKAYRTETTWDFAGIDQKNRKFDITVGRPDNGDDLLALWNGKNWRIISYRCYTDW